MEVGPTLKGRLRHPVTGSRISATERESFHAKLVGWFVMVKLMTFVVAVAIVTVLGILQR